jgi:hypothetical protein
MRKKHKNPPRVPDEKDKLIHKLVLALDDAEFFIMQGPIHDREAVIKNIQEVLDEGDAFLLKNEWVEE